MKKVNVVPRLSTLELLSPILKQDLIALVLRYRFDDYSVFYEINNRLDDKEKYLEIMEFCINSVDTDDELHPKLCHNLAGAYRRNKDFDKALKYSNTGIKSCQENMNFGIPPW